MTSARLLLRIVVISLAAAVFIGLIGIYAGSLKPDLKNPYRQVSPQNRASAPQLSRWPGFIGGCILLVLCAVAGRTVFRLRLSGPSGSEDRMIFLNLSRTKSAGEKK